MKRVPGLNVQRKNPEMDRSRKKCRIKNVETWNVKKKISRFTGDFFFDIFTFGIFHSAFFFEIFPFRDFFFQHFAMIPMKNWVANIWSIKIIYLTNQSKPIVGFFVTLVIRLNFNLNECKNSLFNVIELLENNHRWNCKIPKCSFVRNEMKSSKCSITESQSGIPSLHKMNPFWVWLFSNKRFWTDKKQTHSQKPPSHSWEKQKWNSNI